MFVLRFVIIIIIIIILFSLGIFFHWICPVWYTMHSNLNSIEHWSVCNSLFISNSILNLALKCNYDDVNGLGAGGRLPVHLSFNCKTVYSMYLSIDQLCSAFANIFAINIHSKNKFSCLCVCLIKCKFFFCLRIFFSLNAWNAWMWQQLAIFFIHSANENLNLFFSFSSSPFVNHFFLLLYLFLSYRKMAPFFIGLLRAIHCK